MLAGRRDGDEGIGDVVLGLEKDVLCLDSIAPRGPSLLSC